MESTLESSDCGIIFLGLAEKVGANQAGQIDIHGLASRRTEVLFPVSLNDIQWVFLLHQRYLETNKERAICIDIRSTDGTAVGFVRLSGKEECVVQPAESIAHTTQELPLRQISNWLMLPATVDSIIGEPGTYEVFAGVDSADKKIGDVFFHYRVVPPFSSEQIEAIKSDPASVKAVRIEFGCKFCPSKFKAYTALEQIKSLEEEGYIWQHNLPERFNCKCGKTSIDLRFAKESMHGMLGADGRVVSDQLSYVRRYGYAEINEIARQFNALLGRLPEEEPVQKFIENHPVLLSRFHAQKLFVKPAVLGKYQADFAVLDTSGQLLLIELERPGMKLFRKNGHPTAELMHAYGQVADWLAEYSRFPQAFLDAFRLKDDQVTNVRGLVITGRRKSANKEHLRRHMSHPVYNDIDFMTLDDLSDSLVRISRELSNAT